VKQGVPKYREPARFDLTDAFASFDWQIYLETASIPEGGPGTHIYRWGKKQTVRAGG